MIHYTLALSNKHWTDKNNALKGFELSDIRFNNTPVVPLEDSGIVLSLQMNPFKPGAE